MESLLKKLANGGMSEGFKFLVLPSEKLEIAVIGVPPTLKLKYIKGSREKNVWMKDYGFADGRMWNVDCPGHPFHQSTRMLAGLRELGIIQ